MRLLEALQVAALPGSRIDATALAEIAALDRSNPSSIVSCISAARENLRNVANSVAQRCGSNSTGFTCK